MYDWISLRSAHPVEEGKYIVYAFQDWGKAGYYVSVSEWGPVGDDSRVDEDDIKNNLVIKEDDGHYYGFGDLWPEGLASLDEVLYWMPFPDAPILPAACPFCGNTGMSIMQKREADVVHSDADTEFCVVCEKCGARGPIAHSEENARKLWNRGIEHDKKEIC